VPQLVHLSIAAGVLASIAYWGLAGKTSAVVISIVFGFVYMTGMMVQLDLAARVCEIETAGTTFALLMALSNFSTGLGTWLGGHIYETLADWQDYLWAFNFVVGLGALSTSCCWFLLPTIRRHCAVKSEAMR
jgi:predicted MFS family arabinose efflux permease